MASGRSFPKERIGFGEATIVRDHPGILVVEETHFPVWLWWPCLTALWCGMVALGGLTWGGMLVLLAAYALMVVPLLVAVSVHGYERLSIRDHEALVVTRVPHIGRPKPKRLPLEAVDFVSCEKQVLSASRDDSGSEHAVITVYLKDGGIETVMTVPYCKKLVAALRDHLPGIVVADDGGDSPTPPSEPPPSPPVPPLSRLPLPTHPRSPCVCEPGFE